MTREEAMKKLDNQALVLWKNHPVILEIFKTKVRPKLWELLIGDERFSLVLDTASEQQIQEMLKYHYQTCTEQAFSESLSISKITASNAKSPVPVPARKRSKIKWLCFGGLGLCVLLILGVIYIISEKPDWAYQVEDTVSSIVDKAKKSGESGTLSDNGEKQVASAAGQTSAPLSPKQRMDALEGRIEKMENDFALANNNPWDVLALRAQYISTDAAQKLDDEISAEVKGDALEYSNIVAQKEKEISDLESEIDKKIDAVTKEHVCPLITGQMTDRIDDTAIQIWGECHWGREALHGPFGMGNIVILNPKLGGVISNKTFQSRSHYYVGKTDGENIFGVKVGIYIYDSVEPLVEWEVGDDEQRLRQMKNDLEWNAYLKELQQEYERGLKLSPRLMKALAVYQTPSKALFDDLQNYAKLPTDAGSREQYKKLVTALEGNTVGTDGMAWKFNYSDLTGGSHDKIEVQDGTMYVDPRRNLALIFRYYEQMLDSVLHVVSPKTFKDYCDNPIFQNSLARMTDTQTSFPVDMPLHTHIAKDVLKQAGWHLAGPYHSADSIGTEIVWYALSPMGQVGVPADQNDFIKMFADYIKLQSAPYFYGVPGGLTLERPDVRPWQLVENPEDKSAALTKYKKVITERCPKIWSGWVFKVDYVHPGDKIGLIYPQSKFGGLGATTCLLERLSDADTLVLGQLRPGDWVMVDAVQPPENFTLNEDSTVSGMILTGIEKITVDEKNLKFWDLMKSNSYYLMCRTDGIRMMLLAITPQVFAQRFMTLPKTSNAPVSKPDSPERTTQVPDKSSSVRGV